MTISNLIVLSQLICKSVATLEEECSRSEIPFPNLDDAFTPQSEAFRKNPAAAEAANTIAAAASQLVAMVLPPPSTLYTLVTGSLKSAAVRVCSEANVTEILREGPPEGVHVNDIAAKSNIDGQKLGRLMRYLATHHMYKEVTPDMFTNNRVSSVLDTGKPSKELFAEPEKKHDNTIGITAITGHHMDEVSKAAVCLWETMSDPSTAHSDEITHAPFNRAFNYTDTLWKWFEEPEQAYRLHRFGIGMQGAAALQPADAILKAYDWKSLQEGSVVVDVGGGVGTSSLVLAKEFPHLQIVVQDLPSVIEAARMTWTTEHPEALQSGRIKLQVQDFFKPQQITNASIFLLKQIMHDWADTYAVKILTQLRLAAQPTTKLLLIDSVMPYACHDPTGDDTDTDTDTKASGHTGTVEKAIPGAVPKEAPKPLLANYGIASEMGYNADLSMLLLFNSQERTVKHLSEVLLRTGWRLAKVVRDGTSSGGFLQPVEALPVFD